MTKPFKPAVFPREHVPCKTCGEPTDYLGTRQCNDCHEVEMRLEGYLRRGGAKARLFVLRTLAPLSSVDMYASTTPTGEPTRDITCDDLENVGPVQMRNSPIRCDECDVSFECYGGAKPCIRTPREGDVTFTDAFGNSLPTRPATPAEIGRSEEILKQFPPTPASTAPTPRAPRDTGNFPPREVDSLSHNLAQRDEYPPDWPRCLGCGKPASSRDGKPLDGYILCGDPRCNEGKGLRKHCEQCLVKPVAYDGARFCGAACTMAHEAHLPKGPSR
jgi:hypothetical protein